MEYMLLIYTDEAVEQGMSDTERQEMMAAYGTFTQELEAAGANRGGAPLQSIATATTVRAHGGAPTTTDGPFAETKEQLGGYYLIDCENLDQAIAWAAKIPSAKWGSIEVRPVMSMG